MNPPKQASNRVGMLWALFLMACLGAVGVFFAYPEKFAWLQSLKPRSVEITDDEAREALSQWIEVWDDPDHIDRFQLEHLLQFNLFPPTDFLTNSQRKEIGHAIVARFERYGNVAIASGEERIQLPSPLNRLFSTDILNNALKSALLDEENLARLGLNSELARETFLELGPKERKFLLEPDWETVTSDISAAGGALDSYARRLECFGTFGLLDSVEADSISKRLVNHQVLNGTNGQSQTIHGLFHYGECPFLLHTTYPTLRILKSLNALDSIDREACVSGILRQYQGAHRGFRSSDPAIRMEGDDARYFALESLALLGALDRIEDLDSWRFVARRGNGTIGNQPVQNHIFANTLMIWAYQKRLEELRGS